MIDVRILLYFLTWSEILECEGNLIQDVKAGDALLTHYCASHGAQKLLLHITLLQMVQLFRGGSGRGTRTSLC